MPTAKNGLRPPTQQRSRDSLERVMRASERLLAKKGYEGFTIAEVSRTAKVSIGSVYGRFENKDAVIYEVHRRMRDRLTAPSEELAADAADLPDAVDRVVRGLAGGMDQERALLRAFMFRGAVDTKIARPGSESSKQWARAFSSAVLAWRDQIGHPNPELATDIAFRMVYDVLARHVMYGATFESATEHSWDELVDELIVAAVAYLRAGS